MTKKIAARLIAAVMVLANLVCAMAVPAMAAVMEGGHEIKVVVLDPGHGGDGEGTAATYMGRTYSEAELVLKIARYCRQYLQENYWNVKVLMTREGPAQIGLEERVKFAADNDADFLLSLHLNGLNGRNRGAYMLVPKGIYNPDQGAVSRAGATEVLRELEKVGVRNKGFLEKTKSERYPDGSWKDAYKIVRFGVEMDVPAIISESCFMDNSQDFQQFLSSEEKLKGLGEANARGVAKVLGLEHISRKPAYYNSAAENADAPFEDVFENFWFYDDVVYAYENGLMQGMTEDTFVGTAAANRAMVVTLLYRLEGSQETAATVSFTDVPADAWFYQEVEWAYRNGVTTGMGPGIFCPGQNVTREQFVTFLYRYAQRTGCQTQSDQDLSAFKDGGKISQYALAAVRWAVEHALIKGYDDSTLQPQKSLNRAELAALMHRFDQYLLTPEPEQPEDAAEPTEPDSTEPTEPESTEPTEPDTTQPTDPSVDSKDEEHDPDSGITA